MSRKKSGSISILGYQLGEEPIVNFGGFWVQVSSVDSGKDVLIALVQEKKPKVVYLNVSTAGCLVYDGVQFSEMEKKEDDETPYIEARSSEFEGVEIIISLH